MTRSLRLSLISAVGVACLSASALPARTRVVKPAAPPTFSKEVVRIFQQNCQSCHHPGDVAPFSLMTWADSFPHAENIRYKTARGEMPPWKAVAGCGEFESERKMSQSDIDTIARWVASGAPEGDRRDLPQPLRFDDGWALGAPDVRLQLQQPFTPPAQGDTYRCFPLQTGLTADQWVSTIDVRPGDRKTVHHVIAFLDTTGESERLDAAEAGPGYTCFGGPGFNATGTLGGWAPGSRPVPLPAGVAYKLPKSARVVLQVHYHPHHDAPEPDSTEVGIYFSRERVEKTLRVLPLVNQTFVLPAGRSNHPVTASFQVPAFISGKAIFITPHMHLLGKTMKVEAVYPDGRYVCLINIDDWDFNWQGSYQFKRPVDLPGGTLLTLRATYDNSAGNPRNPNTPPKDVRWGEATTDEMCLAFLGITLDNDPLN